MNLKRILLRNICWLLGLASAIIILLIPLQHYMPLGRYQHYGMAGFTLGLGYFLHCIWTWRDETFWTRLSYALTGLFCSSVGLLFYANPWMASSVQTEEKQLYRWALTGVLMIATFILLIVWLITYVKRPQSVIVQGKSDSE
jgi:H+/Cl- antiporter ClcA